MRRFAVLFSLVSLGSVCAARAQTPVPKPDPELAKLHMLVGHWAFEGEYKPGSWGPAGKMQGEATYRFILNGYVLECRETEKVNEVEAHLLEIDAYDPVNKNITFAVYTDVGTSFSGVLTVSENTISWDGTVSAKGKLFRVRDLFVISDDRTSGTAKGAISLDGKTWQPYFVAKLTKVKPAAKK